MQREITTYLSQLVQNLKLPIASVTVLAPERTFWEKVTLIHVSCNRQKFSENPSRQSRHWYDVAMMYQDEVGGSAIEKKELLADVVKLKKVFYNAAGANYDFCLENKFKLIPSKDTLSALKNDYQKMIAENMFYDDRFLSFDEIINTMQKLENYLNDKV